MHCSITASLCALLRFLLAASAVSACSARAVTESAEASRTDWVIGVRICLSFRCDRLDHGRVRFLERNLVIRSAVVWGRAPRLGRPHSQIAARCSRLVAATGRLHIPNLL